MRPAILIVLFAIVFFPHTVSGEGTIASEPGTVGFKIHGPAYTAYGYEVSCIDIARDASEDSFNFINEYLSGYPSSSNFHKKRNSFKDTLNYTRWIYNYCLENPQDNLVIATQKLDKQIDL